MRFLQGTWQSRGTSPQRVHRATEGQKAGSGGSQNKREAIEERRAAMRREAAKGGSGASPREGCGHFENSQSVRDTSKWALSGRGGAPGRGAAGGQTSPPVAGCTPSRLEKRALWQPDHAAAVGVRARRTAAT